MPVSLWKWMFLHQIDCPIYRPRLVEVTGVGSRTYACSCINSSWNSNNGSKHLLSLKAPTCLLLTPEILEKDMVTADITGKPVLAVDVFALYINTMKDHLVNIMKINEDDIEWILTVPQRWACVVEQLIQCMKKSGKKAGIDELPLRICIVYEPEVTSISSKNILIDYMRGTISYGTVEYEVVKNLICDLGDEDNHIRDLIKKLKDVGPLSFCWNIKQVLTDAKYRMQRLNTEKKFLKIKSSLEPSDRAYRMQRLLIQMEHLENLMFFLNYLVQDANYRMECLIRKRGNWHWSDPIFGGLYYLLTKKIHHSSNRKQHTESYGFLQLQQAYCKQSLLKQIEHGESLLFFLFDYSVHDADNRMIHFIRERGIWYRFHRDDLVIPVELPTQSTKIQTEYEMPKRKEKTDEDHDCLKLKEDDLVIPVELPTQSTNIQTEYEMPKRKEKTDEEYDCLKLKKVLELPQYCEKNQMIVVDERITSENITLWNGIILIVQTDKKPKMKMENNLSDKECLKHEQLDKRQPNAIRIERRG